jgi:two-component system, OmpR family, sensor kinase
MNVDTTDLESLGNYIRARRQALNLTQTQLGQRLGWMQERVSILENGKYGMPSLPALARLAIACEVSLMEILRAAGYGDDSHLEMNSSTAEHPNGTALLYTLQQLIAIDVGTMKDALNQAADLLAGVMGAEKVDAFVYDPEVESLIAFGASNTEMGRRERRVGMDRLAIANRGREVEVFETGVPYLTGHAQDDPAMLVGMVQGLGVKSFLGVPLSVDSERRGVLIATSSKPDQFHEEDVPFFETVARWVGVTAHRAELMEEVQRVAVEKARRTGAEELIEYLGQDTKLHLAPVMQRLSVLIDRARQEGHAEYTREFDFIQERVKQVERSIETLLDASALERGLVSLNLESTDLVELVREVVEEYRNELAPVHIRAPEGLQAQLDADRIRSAIDALVRNAVRRSPGSLPVVIDIGVVQQDGADQVVVSVQDEGTSVGVAPHPGLGMASIPPADSSSFGLSLYQARSAAEAHGGTITVDTPSINTAIFKLFLPLTSRADGPDG